MKLHKAKKHYRFFPLLLSGTVVFIALSVFLVIRVNSVRNGMNDHAMDKQKLAGASVQLADYWNYTYILLGIACALCVLLLFFAFFINRTIDQLVRLKKQNRMLFKNSIDCVCTCNAEGKIIEFNKAAEKIFGYRAGEIRKKGLEILYASKEECDAVIKSLNEKGMFSGEVTNRNKNGKLFISFLSANLLYDNHKKVIGSMGISR